MDNPTPLVYISTEDVNSIYQQFFFHQETLGSIININLAAASLFGYTRTELISY